MALDIRQLLREQQGYVRGMGSVPLSGEYQPTLDEMLKTGSPTSTARSEGAATSAAMREFDRLSQGINERMAAKGKGGSSAQTGLLARAGTETSVRLGEILARIGQESAENAEGRRMGALGEARGQGALELGAKTAQAGAGNDLLSLLMSLGGGGADGGGARPELAGSQSSRQLGQGQNRPLGHGGGASTPSQSAPNPLSGLRGIMEEIARQKQGARSGGSMSSLGRGQGKNAFMDQVMADPMTLMQALAQLTGDPKALGGILSSATAASGSAMGQAAAAGGQLGEQKSQEQFMTKMVEQYGPSFGAK